MTEEEADAFLKANPSRDKFVKKGRTYDLANMHFGKLKVIERAGSQTVMLDGNVNVIAETNALR